MKSPLKWTALAGVVLIAAIATAVTTPAPLPWSATAGKPKVEPGSTTGCFLWSDKDTVTVMTTTQSKKGLRWNGRIEVRGATIVAPRGMKDEKRDGFSQPKPNVLEFSFDTHTNVDGVKFGLKPDPKATPSGDTPKPVLCAGVKLEGNVTPKLYYGAKPTAAPSNPVAFDLTR
ncbi:MAG: hypothetical protein HZB16_23400 [Armatimonadetes bacterium]|nr:hypothetical protein [Armatimonadota bacterium]